MDFCFCFRGKKKQGGLRCRRLKKKATPLRVITFLAEHLEIVMRIVSSKPTRNYVINSKFLITAALLAYTITLDDSITNLTPFGR
jgi:hypothetical protein